MGCGGSGMAVAFLWGASILSTPRDWHGGVWMGTAKAWTPLLRAAQPSSQPLSLCPHAARPGASRPGGDTGRWQGARAGVASRSRFCLPRRGPSEAAPAPPGHGAAKGSTKSAPRGGCKPAPPRRGACKPRLPAPHRRARGDRRPRPGRHGARRPQPFVACPARRSDPARAAPEVAVPGPGSPAAFTFLSSLRMCTACSRLCSRMVAWISRSHPTRRT